MKKGLGFESTEEELDAAGTEIEGDGTHGLTDIDFEIGDAVLLAVVTATLALTGSSGCFLILEAIGTPYGATFGSL